MPVVLNVVANFVLDGFSILRNWYRDVAASSSLMMKDPTIPLDAGADACAAPRRAKKAKVRMVAASDRTPMCSTAREGIKTRPAGEYTGLNGTRAAALSSFSYLRDWLLTIPIRC